MLATAPLLHLSSVLGRILQAGHGRIDSPDRPDVLVQVLGPGGMAAVCGAALREGICALCRWALCAPLLPRDRAP